MSAAEIIELIKKLPPEERAEVAAFLKEEARRVSEAAANYTPGIERRVRTIPQAEAERIAEGIFDRHPELFRRLAQ